MPPSRGLREPPPPETSAGESPPWRADRAGFKPRELIKKILTAGAGPAQVSIDPSERGGGRGGSGKRQRTWPSRARNPHRVPQTPRRNPAVGVGSVRPAASPHRSRDFLRRAAPIRARAGSLSSLLSRSPIMSLFPSPPSLSALRPLSRSLTSSRLSPPRSLALILSRLHPCRGPGNSLLAWGPCVSPTPPSRAPLRRFRASGRDRLRKWEWVSGPASTDVTKPGEAKRGE